jgi:hypothetical protein
MLRVQLAKHGSDLNDRTLGDTEDNIDPEDSPVETVEEEETGSARNYKTSVSKENQGDSENEAKQHAIEVKAGDKKAGEAENFAPLQPLFPILTKYYYYYYY